MLGDNKDVAFRERFLRLLRAARDLDDDDIDDLAAGLTEHSDLEPFFDSLRETLEHMSLQGQRGLLLYARIMNPTENDGGQTMS